MSFVWRAEAIEVITEMYILYMLILVIMLLFLMLFVFSVVFCVLIIMVLYFFTQSQYAHSSVQPKLMLPVCWTQCALKGGEISIL